MSNLIPAHIHWPGQMDTEQFLNKFWQKKPLLIRQAFPGFQSPIDADELAGLSLESAISARIIKQDDAGHYYLQHGPFDESIFSTLGDTRWSLLVTDVEKHIPEFTEYLKPFQFIPDWRIDDIMISYAPVGSSVGAHIDEYDVFLLQGTGKRRWLIDADSQGHQQNTDQREIRLVENFTPTHDWVLEPGDMLYLPPGIAHHGIAEEESCTTWSFGFRAPLITDTVVRISEMIAEELPNERYRDRELQPSTKGMITTDVVNQFYQFWLQQQSIAERDFALFLGKWLTESGEPGMPSPEGRYENVACLPDKFCKAAFSQFAWTPDNDTPQQALLFVNGESYLCAKQLAIQLCALPPKGAVIDTELSDDDRKVLKSLLETAALYDPELQIEPD